MHLIILISFLLSMSAHADLKMDPQKVRNLYVIDKNNSKTPTKSLFSKSKIVVIVNVATGCPMVKKSYATYEKLNKTWNKKDVRFIYLDSSPDYKINKSLAELSKYKTNLDIYFDQEQILTRELGFESTNQLVIIDTAKNEMIYRGAIDSSLNYYTKKSTFENYVDNALTNFFDNKKIEPSQTESFGCAITFKKI